MVPVLLLLSGLASAEEPFQNWEMENEAALFESLTGDLVQAEARYERLVREVLPAGDPSLARTYYRLGHVRYLLGDAQGARDALDACIRTGTEKARCLDLRGEIDLEADAVHEVPVHWTFDDPHHGFMHPRAYWDKGAIRIQQSDDGESRLEWRTAVDANREDMLIVGFRQPNPAPRVIRFTMTSAEIDGMLRVEFVDIDGNRYSPLWRQRPLPRGQDVLVDLDVRNLRPVHSEGPPLDPSALHRMYLLDVTGRTGQVGRNVLRIDDFEVR